MVFLMGIFDKIKNVFFEEEEEEIDIPVKRERPTTVAKKIEPVEYRRREETIVERPKETTEVRQEIRPETRPEIRPETRVETRVERTERVEVRPEIRKEVVEPVPQSRQVERIEPPKRVENDFKFPVAFDDKDFITEERRMTRQQVQVQTPKEVERKVEEPHHQEPVVYNEKIMTKEQEKYSPKNGYTNKSYEELNYSSTTYQGLYEGEKKEKKTGFTRSPILSPVYGILNKNYKKEEIVTKKEVRLSITPKKVDLDTVREKAYGDLASEIAESMNEKPKEDEIKEEKDENLLYDLSEESSPSVKTVTVGDAEEYYNDLGLEYNVDYKVEKNGNSIIDEEKEEPTTRKVVKHEKDEAYTSNLFDLIDSMYEEKE